MPWSPLSGTLENHLSRKADVAAELRYEEEFQQQNTCESCAFVSTDTLRHRYLMPSLVPYGGVSWTLSCLLPPSSISLFASVLLQMEVRWYSSPPLVRVAWQRTGLQRKVVRFCDFSCLQGRPPGILRCTCWRGVKCLTGVISAMHHTCEEWQSSLPRSKSPDVVHVALLQKGEMHVTMHMGPFLRRSPSTAIFPQISAQRLPTHCRRSFDKSPVNCTPQTAQKGLTWGTLGQSITPDFPFSARGVFIVVAADVLIYVLATAYLDKVTKNLSDRVTHNSSAGNGLAAKTGGGRWVHFRYAIDPPISMLHCACCQHRPLQTLQARKSRYD